MSYDVQVFGRRRIEVLSGLVAGSAGLEFGSDGHVRRRGSYSFTVDGPLEVEAEDIPEDVTAHVLEPRWLWTILVEGSSEAEIPHAVKFAKRLAKAAEGAALDLQTGELLAKVGSRITTPPPKDTRIGLFELHWYAFAEGVPTDPVDDWIELCRRYLPEALPRRYGEFEPLQHRLDRDRPELLRELVLTEAHPSFVGTKPCLDGGFFRNEDILTVRLSMHEAVARDLAWQAAVRKLFVAYAVRRAAFLATGEIVGRVLWDGRSISYDGREENTFSLSRSRERWVGLTPYPVWWSWYGEIYRPLVEPHLDSTEVTAHPTGLFHQAGPEPRRRKRLADPLPAGLRAVGHGRYKLTHAHTKPAPLAGGGEGFGVEA
ncbi:hypothetical protein [Kribbella swartbergensis]